MRTIDLCAALDEQFNLPTPSIKSMVTGTPSRFRLIDVTHVAIDHVYGGGFVHCLDYYNDKEPRDRHRYFSVPVDHVDFASLVQFLLAVGITVDIVNGP